MNALDWVRSKAEERETEIMVIEPEEAGEGTKAGQWLVKRWHFRGTLPTRMAYQIRDNLKTGKLERVETGDIQITENLRIGGQYRSDFGKCEYWKTIYQYQGV